MSSHHSLSILESPNNKMTIEEENVKYDFNSNSVTDGIISKTVKLSADNGYYAGNYNDNQLEFRR